jgi:peptide/nickel transport system permease protein
MTTTSPGEERVAKRAPGLRRAGRELLRNPPAVFGAVVLTVFVLVALFAPLIAPHNPRQQNLGDRFTPPVWDKAGDARYLLGTDQLGRDILSRLVYGSRVALAVGVFGTGLALLIGVTLGLCAGYFGGRVDAIVTRITEVIISIPSSILYITILGVFGPSLWLLILVMGLFGWITSARVVRGEVLSLRNREYVEASIGLGQRTAQVLIKHVLPNVLGSIIVVGTLKVASMIILEASLSFLGFGVQPPAVTWGQMLADGRRFITSSWWLATLPGLAISLLTLSLLFLGNWLRDNFDPRTYD